MGFLKTLQGLQTLSRKPYAAAPSELLVHQGHHGRYPPGDELVQGLLRLTERRVQERQHIDAPAHLILCSTKVRLEILVQS